MAAKKKFPERKAPSLSVLGTKTTGLLDPEDLLGNNSQSLRYDYVELGSIAFNPDNDYREEDNEDSILEIADDIHRNGLLHNLVVSQKAPGQYKLLSGERRLRGILLNRERYPGDERYGTVYVQIRENLAPIEEMIIMDAANLEARGGGSKDETRTRKCIARFIGNVETYYRLPHDKAVDMAARVAKISKKTVTNNLDIEENMNAGLLKMADKGVFSKKCAVAFAALTGEEQQTILAGYQGLVKAGDKAAIAEYGEKLLEAISRNDGVESVQPRLVTQVKKAADVQEDRIQKEINKINRAVKSLTKQAAFIRSLQQPEGQPNEGEGVKDRLQAVHQALGELLDRL